MPRFLYVFADSSFYKFAYSLLSSSSSVVCMMILHILVCVCMCVDETVYTCADLTWMPVTNAGTISKYSFRV